MSAPPLSDPEHCTCDDISGAVGDRQVSLEEIAQHCSETSCWVLLRGAVWDLTPFLKDHPGGAGAILEYAGRDGTIVWESIHPPEVFKQLVPSLRIGVADNTLQAAVDAPSSQSSSEQLLHACKMGGSTEVNELLAQRADPNFQGGQGREAPLHWAARKGLPPMMVSLLGASADLEKLDAEGQTPLHLACRNGQQKMAAELLKAKAAVNAEDMRGETPLHAAATLGSVRLVKVLLGGGADATKKDKEGNAPADAAAQQGHSAAEELIAAQME